MKHLIALFWSACLLAPSTIYAFCGFYVAKADAALFNNKSEVILVRDGRRNIITMSSDFQGDIRDFAMVVPVPVVLKREDISVVRRDVFAALDAYSGPRLVEYFDENPCMPRIYEELLDSNEDEVLSAPLAGNAQTRKEWGGVTIEARYEVGEYDILILSATESVGLEQWLTYNGYKVPQKAAHVLQPYILSNMKFFVVKVNLDRLNQRYSAYLSPLQIRFDHDKFMLPIRLGMANSSGAQDMIVYAFTRTGRVECTNYRTVKIPTDRNVPEYVATHFGDVYKRLFQRAYNNEGRNAIFLEYAWDVTPNWGMKCDPCVGPPPMQQEFADAGVYWSSMGQSVFFTRLHVRYTEDRFPSDLVFQETPNREQFQARYIITHPAGGEFGCEEGRSYLRTLYPRRRNEVNELFALTGKYYAETNDYLNMYASYSDEPRKEDFPATPIVEEPGSDGIDQDAAPYAPVPEPALPYEAPQSFPVREVFTMLMMLGLFWLAYVMATKKKWKPSKV